MSTLKGMLINLESIQNRFLQKYNKNSKLALKAKKFINLSNIEIFNSYIG